jgi:hypothetical protein
MRDDVDIINRIANAFCTVALIAAGFYFGYHIFAAVMRGAFQAVTR